MKTTAAVRSPSGTPWSVEEIELDRRETVKSRSRCGPRACAADDHFVTGDRPGRCR